MQIQDVQRKITELAKKLFKPDHRIFLLIDPFDARNEAYEIAEKYWEDRTYEEAMRDIKLKIIPSDYKEWVLDVYESVKSSS